MQGKPRQTCVICAWRESCQKKYSIVDPNMCQDFSRDVSIKELPGGGAVKIIIEGAPGCGKSTLVERLLMKLSDIRAGGFYTREIRKSGERVGFRIITVDKIEGVLAHVDRAGMYMVGRYGVNIEDIEKVAVPSLKRAVTDDELIVIDEIGRMELCSKRFQEMVEIALDSGKPVVATVPSEGTPFVEEIKKRKDVRVIHMDLANRDDILEQVAGLLREG